MKKKSKSALIIGANIGKKIHYKILKRFYNDIFIASRKINKNYKSILLSNNFEHISVCTTYKIQEDFKYPTLVLPGELETTVDIVSICKTKISEVEDLRNQVFKCIENLDKELDEMDSSPTLKRAKDLLDGKEN